MFSIRKYIPRIRWKNDSEALVEAESNNEKLKNICIDIQNINQALNVALGHSMKQNNSIRDEAMFLLSAITFQYGGKLLIKSEFFDLLNNPINDNLILNIDRNDDNQDVVLTLKMADSDNDAIENEGE